MSDKILLYRLTDWPLGEGEMDGGEYPNVGVYDNRNTVINRVSDLLTEYLANRILMIWMGEDAEDITGKGREMIEAAIRTYTDPLGDLEWARFEDFAFESQVEAPNESPHFKFNSGIETIEVQPFEAEVGSGVEYRTDWGTTENA